MSSSQLTVTEAFAESVIHDRHVILGCEMQPFCMDHWLILNNLESPLIHGGIIGITDLQLAVKACSTSSDLEFFDAARRPNFFWRLWAWHTSGRSVSQTLRAFNSYVEDYSPRIPQWSQVDSDPAKCPGIFITAARLVKCGHAPSAVRRMGLGEMTAWVLAIAEAEGDPLKSIKSDIEVITQQEIEAETKAAAAEVTAP